MSLKTATAWELIGWDDGNIRIKGGKAIYQAVMYNCENEGDCVKLCRLEGRSDGIVEVKRYVKPDTIIEILEGNLDEFKKGGFGN